MAIINSPVNVPIPGIILTMMGTTIRVRESERCIYKEGACVESYLTAMVLPFCNKCLYIIVDRGTHALHLLYNKLVYQEALQALSAVSTSAWHAQSAIVIQEAAAGEPSWHRGSFADTLYVSGSRKQQRFCKEITKGKRSEDGLRCRHFLVACLPWRLLQVCESGLA